MPAPFERLLPAVLVHVFTALGIVCALFATMATLTGRIELAFLWLGVALFIDGVDGWLARRYRVIEVLPKFSGETMDLVIDYVTYVFLPVLMLLVTRVVDGPGGMLLAALICMSSLYHFCDEGSKAADNCFVGFPAVWNIVAFYLFALRPPTLATVALILLCVVLTFVRLKWVHPMRVVALRGPTLAMTILWGLAAAWTLWTGFPATGLAKTILIVVALYGICLSVYFGRDGVSPLWRDR
jgi:phosphatidylcholine synthase